MTPAAATKEKPTTNLPALIPAGGMLAPQDDPIARAFSDGIQGVQTNEPPGITIITVDHKLGKFLMSGEPLESFEGYVVNWMQTRAFWENGYKAGSHSPPDCTSADCLVPIASSPKPQAEHCLTCKQAQWGSARVGDGQACKVSTMVFVLNPVFGVPPIACLLAPPSSIKNIVGAGRTAGYLQRAKQFKNPETGKPIGIYQLVWSRFTLERPAEGAIYVTIKAEPLAVAPNAEQATLIASTTKGLAKQMEDLRGAVRAAE